MNIWKFSYYISALLIILMALYETIKYGFNVDKFIIICGYLTGILWCYTTPNTKTN